MNFKTIDIKNIQDYWNKRPCNIRHSKSAFGSKEYFEEVEARKYFVEYHIPEFANFNAYKDKQVLDAGCGIGTMSMSFARAGAHLTSIDFSKESIFIAQQRAELYGFKDIKFLYANCEELLENLPKKNNFDLIFSFGVIHHTPNPLKALDNFHSLLKPGGQLKCMVYYKYSWKVFWIFFKYAYGRFWRISEIVATHSEAQTGCPITYIYSKKQMKRILEARGFRVDKMELHHIFPYQIKKYVNYEYKKIWYFKWMSEKLFKRLEKKLGWHLCITATKI